MSFPAWDQPLPAVWHLLEVIDGGFQIHKGTRSAGENLRDLDRRKPTVLARGHGASCTLWLCQQLAIEKDHRNSGFSH